MNCPGCDKPLERREHAQPLIVQGIKIWPASYCDDCCKANLWRPGSKDALERLITGDRDPEEAARIGKLTEDWLPTAMHASAPTPEDAGPPDDTDPQGSSYLTETT